MCFKDGGVKVEERFIEKVGWSDSGLASMYDHPGEKINRTTPLPHREIRGKTKKRVRTQALSGVCIFFYSGRNRLSSCVGKIS